MPNIPTAPDWFDDENFYGPFQLSDTKKPVDISSPRDFVDEAVADGLIKDGDTRSTYERNYVPVSQRPDRAKAWVDDMARELGNMCFSEEISSWEHRHDARLTDLHKYFPEEYQRILEAIDDAREKVSTLRW